MKYSNLLIFFLFFVTLAGDGACEFACVADVNYKWVKGEKDESTIFWATVDKAGPDETAAKGALAKYMAIEQHRAGEACRDIHENLSGCIAAKYAGVKAQLQSMDFGARKNLQEAIDADCKLQQGKCKEVVAGEPKCAEIVKKVVEAVAGADAAKKDEKGKGKKK